MGLYKHHVEHIAVVHSGVHIGHLLDDGRVDVHGVLAGTTHQCLGATLVNAIDALGHLALETDHLVVPEEQVPIVIGSHLRL